MQSFTAGKTNFELNLGDCIAGMKNMSADSVDAVVTSPPYNLNIQYNKYDDTKGCEDYLLWAEQWAAEIKRVMREDGSFFLNVGSSPSNPMLPHEMVLRLRSLFVLQNTFHWIKSITVETKRGEQISLGHFKPISSKRFVTDCHEYIFHFTKTGNVPVDRLAVGVPYADKSNIRRWGHTNGADRRCRGNNWFIPYKTILCRESERPHPATFPSELATYCFRLHGVAGKTVMDPFLGIGHAGIAAKQCEASKCIGFEIDPCYYEFACKKLAEF